MENHNHPHHNHNHNHSHALTSLNRAFMVGIILNLAFVVVEFTMGFLSDSVGLLSDAGHNMSDVVSLVLAMLAFRLSKTQANKKHTYGYKKVTILVSLVNAVILLFAVAFIVVESIEKFIHPQTVNGSIIIWTAAIGVIINSATAWFFVREKDKDLNVKGAYLHMAADALVSVGVVVSGIIVLTTGWYLIDPIIGLIIAGVIVFSTWNLLRESLNLSIDGVPSNINYEKIKQIIMSNSDIKEIHHLHIWALSTTENALTAHIVLSDMNKMETVKTNIKHILHDVGINHATLEFEPENIKCEDAWD
ncbi:MAG: cation diffusion facilitator family transporter [Prevotellaceae bacterium]|jgi:cobalt-zinc-cadmium efflux system protein|nr:cation diffusion facilitator family transporter [Prevotellaceae bacterium]